MKRFAIQAAFAALLTATSVAQAAPSSGMLLGVYAFTNGQGLRITNTIPGYSAHGVLFSGDTLVRVTADGFNIYDTKSHWQMEHAKDMIGPYRQASLEVFRPGVGMTYFWVEFRPVGGAPVAYSVNGQPVKKQQKMEVRIMTEQQKPGARALFNKGGNQPFNSGNPRPNPRPRPNFPRPGNYNGNPGSLFGR